MKGKAFSKLLAFVLALVLCVTSVPVNAFATGVDGTDDISEETLVPEVEETEEVEKVEEEVDDEAAGVAVASEEVETTTKETKVGKSISAGDKIGDAQYYNVITKKDYVLVPGAATETEMVLNNDAGNRRQVLHVIEVDPSNPDVSIVPGYNQIDKDVTQEKYWSHKELTDMAAYYESNLGYNIVGGMNTDLYYDTYAPRILVYNGKDLSVKGKTSPSSSILYVFQDENDKVTCEVKAFNRTEFDNYLKEGKLLHAVSVSFAMVVKEGKLVNTKETRESSSDAARSMVGVKPDGTLVICMNDGRGANNSQGLSGDFEEGEIMLALGCEWAANCDGGGSSTFLTKRVGEETFAMRSVPCDGAQRPTAHGVFVASNVGPTGELNNVNVEADYDYFAPGSTYAFEAEAIDTHGYSMDMPVNATWKLSDESFGTISNGEFKSNGTKGEVDVQVLVDGNVVGSKSITVTDPTTFKLSATSTVVPYSTTEKVRTIKIPVVARIEAKEADVYFDTNVVGVTLSNDKAGELDGFNFTATSDTSITGVDIDVEYKATGEKHTYQVEFGLGSEVIFDFEDGDKAGFMGFEEAKKWSKDNGVNNTLVGEEPLAGQFNEYLSSETSVVTAEAGGQVRNGERALAWKLDNTDAAFASWSYNVLFNTGDTIVLRDVANGKKATTLGMWLYIPEEALCSAGKGVAFQSQLYTKAASGGYSCVQDHFMFTSAATGKQTNLNSATNADIPESRWVYASIDISKYDYVTTPVADDTGNSRSPSIIRTYVKPDFPADITFYIDDITLDYSSAVDDRVLPTITKPSYSTSDTAVDLTNGVEIEGNKIAFSATVADNAALDNASGKIIVDGVEVKAAVAGSTLSSKEDVNLKAGKHTVAFEVKDELGNPAKIERTFTVKGDAAVELTGHNDSGEAAKAQSIYYVDLKVENPENVSKLVTKLKLNNANKWETKGATVANGFKATYEYNEVSELLTVTVEAVNAAKISADNKTVVSIPVRVWTYDRYNYVTDTYYDPSELFKKDNKGAEVVNKPDVDVVCKVVYGEVTNTDKTTTPFGGSINVETELTTISSPYHTHDTELTTLNQAPTVSSEGYENRTYCETCKSVVDWGTILEKLNHNYEIVDGQFVCKDEGCGDVYKSGTGIFEMNGKLYYSINSVLKTGWQTVDEGYCYASRSTYEVYTGEKTIGGIKYSFDENGILENGGAWVTTDKGTKFSYGPGFYSRMWVEIDGKTYYFGRDSYMYTGIRFVKDNPETDAIWYDFGTDGATDKNVHPEDGVYELKGEYYVVKDGITQVGLQLVDGHYYYGGVGSGFEEYGYVARNTTISVTGDKANGLLNSGKYEFDNEGKMIIYHGPVNGYVYINGNMQHAYKLVECDGSYYYIGDGHKYTVNKTVYLSKQKVEGTKIEPGNYDFGSDGKMIILNGPQTDGFLYIDGVKQLAYQLVKFNGHYYFISDYNKYVTNKTVYLSSARLEGTGYSAGYYDFDAEGKMIVKNGPQTDGFLYIDGVKQLAYQLVKFDGYYYFISDYNKYVTNKTVYLSSARLEGTGYSAGYYDFDAEGKMIIKNGPQADGFLYIDGVKQLAYQLVKFDGHYYFISDYNKYVTNKTVYLSSARLEGTGYSAGYFDFDAEGKMIIKNGPQTDGYFYIDGVKQKAYQLIEFDGYYYFISDNNKYVKDKRTYVSAARLEGTGLKAGYFDFDAEGKMVIE